MKEAKKPACPSHSMRVTSKQGHCEKTVLGAKKKYELMDRMDSVEEIVNDKLESGRRQRRITE